MIEEPQKPQTPPRVGRLDTVRRVRREMTRVYKDMRVGNVHTGDGSRLVFALTCIQKAIEFETFEGRLSALEDAVGGPERPSASRQPLLSRRPLDG